MVRAGSAAFLEKRSLWRLTDAGRDEHAARLAETVVGVDVAALPYERFLSSNATFKELCTDWQVRDGEPNDHTDAAYDDAVIARLESLDAEAQSVLREISAVLPWTEHYGQRLRAALGRLRAGDTKAFTGVLSDSYHDIWMELHEDLIITQGIDRAAEGST
ncbi:MarR family transcriptional regulator [Actinospongicola halichondriae]|uniref:MarR family transcriptional regulator n=1 Tax=Actinospongicola halichondriae TaxID=3236844 RepID=UPI003D527B59